MLGAAAICQQLGAHRRSGALTPGPAAADVGCAPRAQRTPPVGPSVRVQKKTDVTLADDVAPAAVPANMPGPAGLPVPAVAPVPVPAAAAVPAVAVPRVVPVGEARPRGRPCLACCSQAWAGGRQHIHPMQDRGPGLERACSGTPGAADARAVRPHLTASCALL